MKAGWEVKALGEVVRLEYGKPLPNDLRSADGKYAVYGANGEKTRSNAFYAKGPSLIVGRKGSAGEINIAPDDFWPLDVTYYTEHDPDRVEFGFLHYALSMLDLPSMARGVKPGINRNDVYALPIPLPPLDEQKRIVEVLDAAFEGLSRARAHTETNLQNARELFELSFDDVLSSHSDQWLQTTLGEIYDVRDGTHDSPNYVENGHALITSKNLGRDGLHFEKVKFISNEDFLSIRKRSGVHTGDVLFAMIGTIGNPIVVEVEPNFAIKNVALFKMKNGRNGHFLRYFLSSKRTVEKMLAEAKGTTQQFVGLGYLRSFPICAPNPQDEGVFLSKFRDMEELSKQTESHYRAKLADLDALRQALLQKAFAGELT